MLFVRRLLVASVRLAIQLLVTIAVGSLAALVFSRFNSSFATTIAVGLSMFLAAGSIELRSSNYLRHRPRL